MDTLDRFLDVSRILDRDACNLAIWRKPTPCEQNRCLCGTKFAGPLLAAQFAREVIGDGLQAGLIDDLALHLEHQIGAALKVETQIDGLARQEARHRISHRLRQGIRQGENQAQEGNDDNGENPPARNM